MLTVYRRHRATCPMKEDRYARRGCRCVLWGEGTIEGDYLRRSLKTRSWERAAELVRSIEAGDKAALPEPEAAIPTVDEAIRKFLTDAEHGRRLSPATVKKYRVLLAQLAAYAHQQRCYRISEITADFAREFRATWKDGAISSVKKLERFKGFLRMAVESGWLVKNPAASVARPRVKQSPTLPFSDAEIKAMLQHAEDPRWHALIQILRWSGLRIGDAMKLTESQFDKNRLRLRTAKTGADVFVPLPEFVIRELKTLPKYGGHLFWHRQSGESKVDTATGNARRALRKIFESAGIKNGHPHRFRDTFSVGLLEKGVPVEVVAALLGHADVRITQKHYSPWIRSRQEHLEKAVAATWPTPF